MTPIYQSHSPFPGVSFIEIYEPVVNGDHSYYPINVSGKSYHLKINEDGHWCAEGLSEDLCEYMGDVVERMDA